MPSLRQLGLFAALAALLIGLVTPATAAAPKPKLSLVTKTQEGALRAQAIIVGVEVQRKARVTARARVVIHGAGDDVKFRVGPKGKRIKGQGKFRLNLNARKHELLLFALETCSRTTVSAKARARADGDTAGDKLRGSLRRHSSC